MAETDDNSVQHPCPDCQTPVVGATSEIVLQCPQCGRQFFQPETEEAAQTTDSTDEQSSANDDELSGLHIRQITVQRRAAIRARSYCVIGAAACVVIAIQLAYMMLARLRVGTSDNSPMPRATLAGEAILILGFIWGLASLCRRTIHLTREVRRSDLNDPQQPPDFSTLSDGSQFAKHLGSMNQSFASPTNPVDTHASDRDTGF